MEEQSGLSELAVLLWVSAVEGYPLSGFHCSHYRHEVSGMKEEGYYPSVLNVLVKCTIIFGYIHHDI